MPSACFAKACLQIAAIVNFEMKGTNLATSSPSEEHFETRHQNMSDSGPSIRKLAIALMVNLRLLILGPLIAGLVAYGIASLIPQWYMSVAYLALDQAGARDASVRMLSMPLLDKVLSNSNVPGATIEARRRYLAKNIRIVAAPGELAGQASLFRLEVSDKDPRAAQSTSSRLIEFWLDSTKPPPDRRAVLAADIERIEIQTKLVSQMIDRLQKEASSLVAPGSLAGELATPISNLVIRRDQNLEKLILFKRELNGLSHDVIFAPPNLPQEPSWPKKGIIAILTTVAAGLLLFMFVLLRDFWPFPNRKKIISNVS